MRAAQVRDWCRRAIAGHRVLAVVIGTVVLFGCATISPLIKDPGSLSPTELTVAAVTYVSFAAIAVAALSGVAPGGGCGSGRVHIDGRGSAA